MFGLKGQAAARLTAEHRLQAEQMFTFALIACVAWGVSDVAHSSDPPLILVVEDEDAIQGLIEDALNDAGFASDILSSAEEALTIFGRKAKDHRALVTDVNLKGRLNGWDLAQRVREKEPSLP